MDTTVFELPKGIDLTLKGDGLTLSDVFQLENRLDDLLLPYKFDVSIYDHIENSDLLAHVGRVGVVFYERQVVGEVVV